MRGEEEEYGKLWRGGNEEHHHQQHGQQWRMDRYSWAHDVEDDGAMPTIVVRVDMVVGTTAVFGRGRGKEKEAEQGSD